MIRNLLNRNQNRAPRRPHVRPAPNAQPVRPSGSENSVTQEQLDLERQLYQIALRVTGEAE